jgi:hypothetical protein
VWHYHKPQRCFTALVEQVKNNSQRVSMITHQNPASPTETQERIEIPIPTMDWKVCPDGDERLQGIARLRALGENR